MGLGLREYAAMHPTGEPPQEQAKTADPMEEARRIRDKVDRAKAALAAGLEMGTPPESLLYTALDAIGIMDNDPTWAEPLKEKLDSIYGDLAQQSFVVDNEAIAAGRLDRIHREHNAKLRRDLNRMIGRQAKIETALRGALRELDDLEAGDKPILE
jgi:hypothetical protein